MNFSKFFSFKVWGIRVKVDDIMGVVFFTLTLYSLWQETWGGVIFFAVLGLAMAVPEDDAARQWMEILASVGIVYAAIILADLPIPLAPLGMGFENLALRTVKWIAAGLATVALIANLLELLPVLGKFLWETFHKEAERSDVRRKKNLERKLKDLD